MFSDNNGPNKTALGTYQVAVSGTPKGQHGGGTTLSENIRFIYSLSFSPNGPFI